MMKWRAKKSLSYIILLHSTLLSFTVNFLTISVSEGTRIWFHITINITYSLFNQYFMIMSKKSGETSLNGLGYHASESVNITILVYVFASKNVSDALVYSPKKKGEFWRFLTYIFLHNDCIHLGLNIVIQCVLGVPLEYEQGHIRTGGVYIGGGLAGSLGTSVFENESMLIGASGCIYALLISHISHIILNHNSLKYVLHRSLAVTILTVADLAHICYHMYVFNNESPRIGLAAHLGGALSGFLCGSLFFNGTVKWKNRMHLISAAAVTFLLILVLIFNLKSAVTCKADA